MNFLQSVENQRASSRSAEAQARAELNDKRRGVCNRAARILRKLGFTDARAAQSDTGRRDATAVYKGETFHVGVFWDGDVGLLPPNKTIYPIGWHKLSPDLSDLPKKLKPFLW